jgi:hypothetical protein
MYIEAYPQENMAHARTPLLRSTKRFQLPRSPDKSPEGQHVISRRTIVSLLSPSSFIGSAVRDAVARAFARWLKVQPTSWQPWFCKSHTENNYRRDNRLNQCTNGMDGRKFLLQSYYIQ